MRRSIVVVIGVVLFAACQDQGPRLPSGGALPQYSMQNNSFFGFIAPVPPGSTVPAGDFHAFAAPEVRICRVTNDTCTPVVTADMSTTTTHSGSSTLGLVTVDLDSEQYQTNWSGLNALRNSDPTAVYRIHVWAAPISGAPLQFMGTAEVALASGTSAPIVASGNTLPIKVTILVGAFCEDDDCSEFLISNDNGGTVLLTEAGNILGIDFGDGDFIDCDDPNTPCVGEIVVSVSRYRGPDRCIPTETTYPGMHAIHWESCTTVRVAPYGVKVKNVEVGVCIDPRADTYAASGHLRLLKVRETEAGVVMPATVVDLNAVLAADFFFDCGDEFDPGAQASAGASGVLSRLASHAAHALRPVAALLGPSPLHARRSKGPFVASLEDFSRLGTVLPVTAFFDLSRDNAVGLEHTELSESSAPRVRVQTTRIPGSDYFLVTEARPVAGVAVLYTATAGGGSAGLAYTDAQGWATASWTLGGVADNPQTLLAEVGYPDASFQNGDFPNPLTPWATHTFTATAVTYTVYFQSPLGTSGAPGPNVTDISPSVRVCGPLDPATASAAPGQSCASVHATLPAPTLKNGVWETAWKSDKSTLSDSLYRIDFMVNGVAIGAVLARRGGGGGGLDPEGTYQFQNGSNVPVKAIVNLLSE
jgi:hypothetical protein